VSGQSFARFNAAARQFYEPDIGLTGDDDEGCSIGPCEDDAVYRVPWPTGGEVAYCPYHLARYRALYPELWDAVQEAIDDDLSAYATQGDRFLTFEDIPETLFSEDFRAIALLTDGRALYEREHEDTVIFRAVDRSLEDPTEREVDREHLDAFVDWVEHEIGVHCWAGEHGGDGE